MCSDSWDDPYYIAGMSSKDNADGSRDDSSSNSSSDRDSSSDGNTTKHSWDDAPCGHL
jgi:hypothetical protein